MASRTLQVVIAGDASSVNRAFRSVDTQAKATEAKTKKHLAGVSTAFKTAGIAAAGGLVLGLKKSADAAIEAEKSQVRMVTQLKAAGVSYKDHAKQIDDVIQKTSKLSGLDDEDLQDSFTNIVRVTGDVSKSLKLTGLAADFARAKHIDVAKAGEIVAKVAGGNTGILSRYGLQIDKGASSTEALGVLQKKFGGQAEAYGKTTGGALDRVGVAGENLGEVVGAKVTPILAAVATGFVDLIDKTGQLAGPIRTMTGFFKDHTTTTTILASVLGGLATAFTVYKVAVVTASAATKVAAATTAVLNAVMAANPIGLVVLAIAGLTAGLVIAYKRSETFRKIVDGAFRAVSGAASTLAHAVVAAFNWIKRLPGRVAGVFNDVKDAITKRFNAIVNGAERIGRGIVNAVTDFVKRLPGRVWNAFVDVITAISRAERRGFDAAANVGKKIVSGVVSFVSKLGARAWDAFVGLLRQIGKLERQGAAAALNVGKKIVGGVIDGIGNIGHKIVDKIKGGVDWAVDKLKDIGKKLNPFGDGIGRVSGDGIGKAVGGALPRGGAVGSLMGAQPALGPFAAIGAGFGLHVSSGRRPGSITSSGNVSFHSSGEAIDMADGRGPDNNKLKFFNYMKNAFGGRLAELIYTPGGAGIKNGQSFQYTGSVAADHYDHVHVALDTGRPGVGDGLGKFVSTSYGPPWGGIQGTGTTATGVDLHNNPHVYGIAVDPSKLKLGKSYYAWPNPFGYRGKFKAFDTGGAIKGNRIDFYDWRGRSKQMGWGRRTVELSTSGPGAKAKAGAKGKTPTGSGGKVTGVSFGQDTGPSAGASLGMVGAGAGAFAAPKDGPTELDYINAAAATASLTAGTADDIRAATGLRDYYQRAYDKARKTADPRDDIDAATNLKSAIDALAALTEAVNAQTRIEEERAAVNDEILANQKLLLKLAGQGDQILAAVIAAVNGGLGGKVGLGFASPSYPGGVATY